MRTTAGPTVSSITPRVYGLPRGTKQTRIYTPLPVNTPPPLPPFLDHSYVLLAPNPRVYSLPRGTKQTRIYTNTPINTPS